MITRIDAILNLVSGNIAFKDKGVVDYIDGQTPPTEKAIQAKLTELQNAEPMRVMREERNRKLAETDWRAGSDLTLGEWATYRQALRDLPATAKPKLDDNGNLKNVSWPNEPS